MISCKVSVNKKQEIRTFFSMTSYHKETDSCNCCMLLMKNVRKKRAQLTCKITTGCWIREPKAMSKEEVKDSTPSLIMLSLLPTQTFRAAALSQCKAKSEAHTGAY